MAVHRANLSCETCKGTTPHRFEYPSEDYSNMAMCETCETLREISIEVRSQLSGSANSSPAITLTTAPSLSGHEIIETIEIVTAECVMAMSMFADLSAALRDLVGGRSAGLQESLRQARRNCLAELRKEAADVNANAVIGVRLAYSEISGGGKSMLFLVASGTAVRVVATSGAHATDEGGE